MKSNHRFNYRPVDQSQVQLVHKWLAQPHIKQWLHGDGLKNTLEDLGQFVHQGKPWAQHWIAYDDLIPFAYLITSEIERATEHSEHAITLDLFICRLDYIGKGWAVQMIHEFLISQFPDVDVVMIDPEATNERAIHVYKKAGFNIIGEFIASWHPVLHYQMKLNMKELGSARS